MGKRSAGSSATQDTAAWRRGDAPIRIGVSACLLGNPVRYDGGHKRNALLVDLLGAWVEWVPVCPEIEFGLGVPRPTLRLEHADQPGEREPNSGTNTVRLVQPQDRLDLTAPMRRFARKRAMDLEGCNLSGYVLKKDSPSCGLERVKVYGARGAPRRDGRGLFASALIERFPLLPVEEEGRLSDLVLRENFIERVFAYHRLEQLFAGRWTIGQLVEFHTAHKLQVMAHSPDHYRKLGRLVASARDLTRPEIRRAYRDGFMTALQRVATRPRHVNVMEHMVGYLRRGLTIQARQELRDLVGDYRAGLVPLIVPLTMLKHHIRSLEVQYLQNQVYLEPHPKELMLRNHA